MPDGRSFIVLSESFSSHLHLSRRKRNAQLFRRGAGERSGTLENKGEIHSRSSDGKMEHPAFRQPDEDSLYYIFASKLLECAALFYFLGY